ncbi:hypothetical protein LJR219_004995 [Phenylobacterium sp. LjRoot219]|uniref:hypothetical protein n=1 Tax=Phenylobacterium sp. LjRoot219 TaxID=3342283 RepID=UPI003ECDE3A7
MDLPLQHHVKAWVSRALADAHHQRLDLARRLPPISVAQRLRRKARRLALSPSGYEQLLRHALAAAADHGERSCRALELRCLLRAPDPLAQLSLRMQVLAAGRDHNGELIAGAAAREERRSARRRAGDPDEVAARLVSAAGLNRALWDHPGLAAEPSVRASMLACAARLESRAVELSPPNAGRLLLAFTNLAHPKQEIRNGAQPARP